MIGIAFVAGPVLDPGETGDVALLFNAARAVDIRITSQRKSAPKHRVHEFCGHLSDRCVEFTYECRVALVANKESRVRVQIPTGSIYRVGT